MNSITVKVLEKRCEYKENPLGIDTPKPRFSWKIKALKRAAGQVAYNIQVWDETGKCIWDTGKCESDNTVNVQYEGQPLESRKEYRWTLKVWDKQGDEYETDAEKFETAILEDSEWKAEWIRGGNLLRKEFSADKKIKKSRVYISGLGYYELYINGDKIGNHVLDPAWTDFDQKIYYSVYDVTESVKKGKNAVGVMLGNGRYSPYETTIAKNWHPLKKYGEYRYTTICYSYSRLYSDICTRHSNSIPELEEVLIKHIKEVCSRYINENLQDELINMAKKQKQLELKQISNEKRLETLEQKISDIGLYIKNLYMDKVKGVVNENDYISLVADFTKDKDNLIKEKEELIKIINNQKPQINETAKIERLAKDFLSLERPTKQLLNELIEKITISENKEINIYFKFNKLNEIKKKIA